MLLLAAHDTAVLAIEFNITPEVPPGANGFLRLLNWGLWAALLACVAAIVYNGAKMGWEKWNQGATTAPKALIATLAGAVISGGANGILNAITAA